MNTHLRSCVSRSTMMVGARVLDFETVADRLKAPLVGLSQPLRALEESLGLLRTIRTDFLGTDALAVALHECARLPDSDPDLLARFVEQSARLRDAFAQTHEEKDPPSLLRAISVACLCATAVDRFGGDGVDYLRETWKHIRRIGCRAEGFGRRVKGDDGSSIDTRWVAARVLADFACVLLIARQRPPKGDDPRAGGSDDAGDPLDDRLAPRPWASPDRPAAPILELVNSAEPGDCWIRGLAGLAIIASGLGVFGPAATRDAFEGLLRQSPRVALRKELRAARAALRRDLRSTSRRSRRTSTPVLAATAPAETPSLVLSQVPAAPHGADRCRECRCDSCPIKPA